VLLLLSLPVLAGTLYNILKRSINIKDFNLNILYLIVKFIIIFIILYVATYVNITNNVSIKSIVYVITCFILFYFIITDLCYLIANILENYSLFNNNNIIMNVVDNSNASNVKVDTPDSK
jgi:cytochrome c biogenesis factor